MAYLEGKDIASIAEALHEAQVAKFGDFTLKSGSRSPVYWNARDLRSSIGPKQVVVGEIANWIFAQKDFPYIADVPTGVTPIVASVADRLWIPHLTPRPPKDHGAGGTIDGIFEKGQEVLLIEDTVITGGSVLEAARTLRENGLVVEKALCIIDRLQGGVEALAKEGVDLEALTEAPTLLKYYFRAGMLDRSLLAVAKSAYPNFDFDS